MVRTTMGGRQMRRCVERQMNQIRRIDALDPNWRWPPCRALPDSMTHVLPCGGGPHLAAVGGRVFGGGVDEVPHLLQLPLCHPQGRRRRPRRGGPNLPLPSLLLPPSLPANTGPLKEVQPDSRKGVNDTSRVFYIKKGGATANRPRGQVQEARGATFREPGQGANGSGGRAAMRGAWVDDPSIRGGEDSEGGRPSLPPST